MTVMVPEPLVGDLDFCDPCFPTVKEPGEWVCGTCREVGCTRYQSNGPDDYDHATGDFLCRNHQYQYRVGRYKRSDLGWPDAANF